MEAGARKGRHYISRGQIERDRAVGADYGDYVFIGIAGKAPRADKSAVCAINRHLQMAGLCC